MGRLQYKIQFVSFIKRNLKTPQSQSELMFKILPYQKIPSVIRVSPHQKKSNADCLFPQSNLDNNENICKQSIEELIQHIKINESEK